MVEFTRMQHVRKRALHIMDIDELSRKMDNKLNRCLNTADLTFIGIGTMIGTGVYVVTGITARNIAGLLSFVPSLFYILMYIQKRA